MRLKPGNRMREICDRPAPHGQRHQYYARSGAAVFSHGHVRIPVGMHKPAEACSTEENVSEPEELRQWETEILLMLAAGATHKDITSNRFRT